MNDVVISGRISMEKMHELKALNKTNTEIINEALDLYIDSISNDNNCIRNVYKQKDGCEYILLCKALDSLSKRYNKFGGVFE